MTAHLDVREAPPLTLVPDDLEVLSGWESQRYRITRFVKRHRVSLAVLGSLMLLAGFVHVNGMLSYPQRVDDEGTYAAQAWAMQHLGRMTHYTYWYDHPPLGWAQIAGWTWITAGFQRYSTAVGAAREAMLVAKLASMALIYVLARRLSMRRTFAAVAVAVFSLSPLAVQFQRMVFLDNIATPWMLAAFVCATSRNRKLSASALSALCFVIAVLSKETTLVVLPTLIWQLRQSSDVRTRRFSYAVFGSLFALLLAAYPLYALLKSEFFAGDGHVSLLWSTNWQLSSRPPTGSLLDLGSKSWGVVRVWADLDPVVLVLGLVAIGGGFLVRRLRPVTLALTIFYAMTLRNGYLPFPYIIAVLPFISIVFAGVLDEAWGRYRIAAPRSLAEGLRERRSDPDRAPDREQGSRRRRRLAVVAVCLGVSIVATPRWASGLNTAMTASPDRAAQQATAWVRTNVPKGSTVVVDDSFWVDLTRAGYDAVWFFKLDLDPSVKQRYPVDKIDYLVLINPPSAANEPLPTLSAALRRSQVVASFGTGADRVTVLKMGAP